MCFFPVHLFLYVVCLAVLKFISMAPKRPKKTLSIASASSSTSSHSASSVDRVRSRGRAGYHGHYGHRVRTDFIQGHPAAFLSGGLWFSKGHLGSLWLILCSVAPCLPVCSVCAIIDLLTCYLFISLPTSMVVLFPFLLYRSIRCSLFGCSFMGHHRQLMPSPLSIVHSRPHRIPILYSVDLWWCCQYRRPLLSVSAPCWLKQESCQKNVL